MLDTFTQTSTADLAKPLPAEAVIARIYSLGRIAAGIPIEAIDDHQREELLALLSSAGRYALRVCDDSMIEAGIFNGDVVVIQSQRQARNGDIVVALIDDEQITIKRIRYKGTDRIQLLSDNAAIEDLSLAKTRVTIQGKIVGQIRRYR